MVYWYVNINGHISKDKWQSMFRYLAKYVKILIFSAYVFKTVHRDGLCTYVLGTYARTSTECMNDSEQILNERRMHRIRNECLPNGNEPTSPEVDLRSIMDYESKESLNAKTLNYITLIVECTLTPPG